MHVTVCVQAQNTKLPEGATLRNAILQELNSKTAAGDALELEMIDDVDGVIVIEAGTPVKGEITEAFKAKSSASNFVFSQ